VYECFDGNAVEVEIMLDCLGTQHILSQLCEFALLIELDFFVDVHSVPPGPEPSSMPHDSGFLGCAPRKYHNAPRET
jgi:hypothetical protein